MTEADGTKSSKIRRIIHVGAAVEIVKNGEGERKGERKKKEPYFFLFCMSSTFK